MLVSRAVVVVVVVVVVVLVVVVVVVVVNVLLFCCRCFCWCCRYAALMLTYQVSKVYIRCDYLMISFDDILPSKKDHIRRSKITRDSCTDTTSQVASKKSKRISFLISKLSFRFVSNTL